jgi:hypothetical protein
MPLKTDCPLKILLLQPIVLDGFLSGIPWFEGWSLDL